MGRLGCRPIPPDTDTYSTQSSAIASPDAEKLPCDPLRREGKGGTSKCSKGEQASRGPYPQAAKQDGKPEG